MIIRGDATLVSECNSGQVPRQINRAISEWLGILFSRLAKFLRNQSCVMRGEIDPQIAAQEYQDQLDLLATQRGEPIYRHDLILLGFGDDGHTASLFPGTVALDETVRRVVANFVPKLDAWRLTFTFSLINHAGYVCFLVGAAKNADLIERVLEGDPRFPALRVNPSAGDVTWIIGE
jgi:6-phosphogluconolactonase